MSGRVESGLPPDPRTGDVDDARDIDDADPADDPADPGDPGDGLHGEVRRARWAAAGAGGVLAVAGMAAALLRINGSAPALVPAAYACGAAVCVLAAVLGTRGRTRRALWLLIVGLLVMALGDQFD